MELFKPILIAFLVTLIPDNSPGQELKMNPSNSKVIPIYFQSDVNEMTTFIAEKFKASNTDEMIRSCLSLSTKQLQTTLASSQTNPKSSIKKMYNYEILANKLTGLIQIDKDRFSQNVAQMMERDKQEFAIAWVRHMEPASQDKIVDFIKGKKEDNWLTKLLVPWLLALFSVVAGFGSARILQRKAALEERRRIEFEKRLEKLDSIYKIVEDTESQYFPPGTSPSATERVNDRPPNQNAAYQSLIMVGSTFIFSSELRNILNKLKDELNPLYNGQIKDEKGGWRDVYSKEVFDDFQKTENLLVREKQQKI